jgi:dimethylamine/trimethylamine dehydrogenase
VGVGRFTSADTMVSQIKRGVLDLIGAARPSIADPFLPRKIDEGRIEDIRECIGCNICVAQDNIVAPIRCTQNPTQGEEWKQGWHPEKIAAAASDDTVLVIGAGPAGLECALQLANRGYQVTLAEATQSLGGRINHESELPGLSSYARVRDYREYQLGQKPNVEIYLDNRLSAEDVIALEIPHVLVATGSHWRNDGRGRQHAFAVAGIDSVRALTPDDVFAGADIEGRVLIYDDDHYFMGSTLAERFRQQGHAVCLVTPAGLVALWTQNTLEQAKIQARLLDLEVDIRTTQEMLQVSPGEARIANVYSAKHQVVVEFDTLVMVTSRDPNDDLFQSLQAHQDNLQTLRAIGDCNAPGTVAAAVYDGHSAARYLQSQQDIYAPLFVRDIPGLN